jgi:hypothetical protein
MKSARLLLVTLLGGLFGFSATLKADPAQAEDVAYRMATTYIAKSFQMAPTDHSGVLGSGQAIRFIIPVTKGLDYVFLAGADDFAKDVDIYVYDEVGGLILDDRRSSKLAGVQFRSAYNGTAVVYLHMARADGLASYCVLVGRRGAAAAKEGAPVPEEGLPPGAVQKP